MNVQLRHSLKMPKYNFPSFLRFRASYQRAHEKRKEEKEKKERKRKKNPPVYRTDGWMDGPRDGRTDTSFYRDARTHLKNIH